jgi:hypothetical protein
MTLLIGLLIVTSASSIALFVNDRFHLGGYIDESELAVQGPPDADQERTLAAAVRD